MKEHVCFFREVDLENGRNVCACGKSEPIPVLGLKRIGLQLIVIVGLQFGLQPGSAFAATTADCKTPEACIEMGDKSVGMNPAWANASYLKAIALSLREIERDQKVRGK